MASSPSPFLDPGTHSAANTLGILQLKRDQLIPAVLSASTEDSDYAEGKVENTRFGSFPHSTLLNQVWGTQILASIVDTGSRGSKSRKRRREGDEDGTPDTPNAEVQESRKKAFSRAVKASSGFAHLVPPTPETWTLCLPHRTQVVYTPDYSYILQRLGAKPGDHIIEAGAGSGSFTHAAVRAVFNGYPEEEDKFNGSEGEHGENGAIMPNKKRKRYGRVYSFEFHEPRTNQLKSEIEEHGLDSLVTVTNRDVYQDGFCLSPESYGDSEPNADVIFLDLPAPWLALKHLARSPPSAAVLKSVSSASDPSTPNANTSTSTIDQQTTPSNSFQSSLNPNNAVRICTFSPCIEQVTKTVSALRSLGWLEISMVEILSKRLEVRRERIGLQEEGLRGANPSAATVQEAVQRLRDVEGRAKAFHGLQKEKQEELMRRAEAQKRGEKVAKQDPEEAEAQKAKVLTGLPPSKHDRLEQARSKLGNRELFKEGRLVHRTEPELKTHTSYLVFAVLPREWGKEDEAKARKKWG
ncbi:tRNA methyltransferase complex GCD14 subunit [Zopfia rhizophila CBS 207.26]|uniref:tRNA (adenine(58)-N(1))-methyltransferase catalytic subunit TRM61 n=1 Tax=Zopfia rhizophila CBS 207.26 TaxID=1314779 RepID=A0A6A6EM83_9PEZI|nr:tRNA methyltransferase complex GCD14 subunit [Zopfia rhizophila CBS 207.26]